MTDYKKEQWKHVSLHELTNMPDSGLRIGDKVTIEIKKSDVSGL